MKAFFNYLNNLKNKVKSKLHFSTMCLMSQLPIVTYPVNLDLTNRNLLVADGPNIPNAEYIITNEFDEHNNRNNIRPAKDFINTNDTLIGDKYIPLSKFSNFYGVENGKLKAGNLQSFDKNTVVVPNRAKNVGKIKEYQPEVKDVLEYKYPFGNYFETEYINNVLYEPEGGWGKAYYDRNQNDYDVDVKAFEKYLNTNPKQKEYFDKIKKEQGEDSYKKAIISQTYPRRIEEDYHRKFHNMKMELYKTLGERSENIAVKGHPSFVVTTNNDTIRDYYTNSPKVLFANEDGNAFFTSNINDPNSTEKINEYLIKHPSYPIMVDNGRYSFIRKDGDVASYAGDLLPYNNMIIGVEKQNNNDNEFGFRQ